ncbi:hypothetical protein EGW08_008986 [Elysia chlorotica]|uniref:NTR domain-containing protein n=1 Tax=Elysia chlorotica TaxID=188477 RepID=A0A3S1HNZ9_ELYCH|nr:hypothetical protein EGW08_008986 [Elysia chlorotica]
MCQVASKMARLGTSVLGALCLLNIALLASGTKFLVTLPREPHYDSEVLATVTAVGVPPEGDYVGLTYRGAKDTSRVLNRTELQFKKDGVQTWGVLFPWKTIQNLEEKGVTLEVGNVETKLDFTPDPGYIFIQTDKPIYTPRQTVRFRIIAVDDSQRLAVYQLKVDIKNPSNIIVDRMRYSAEDAFKGQTFQLPREATEGIWSISANYEGLDKTYSSSKTVEFEVREYVLPRFSAALDISTDVISRDTGWVSFNISGKYVYGRPLLGKVEMQLGMWDEDNGVQLLPHWYRGELEDGRTSAHFMMTKVFPTSQVFPNNKRLYVSLNVTETGTGENDTIVDTSVYLSSPYYEIDFSAADQFFKPGFPYTLKADVRSKSGVPASSVQLYNVYFFKDKDGNKIENIKNYRKTDMKGRFEEVFTLPEKTEKVEIMVGVLDWVRHVYTDNKHRPAKHKTLTNQYIHVSLVDPIQQWRDGTIQILYTTDGADVQDITKITIQVLSKAQVIFTTTVVKNSDGRSIVKLPRELFHEASPSMRVLAYYYATLGEKSEFVVDSLLVDTENACIEEIHLDRPGGFFGVSSNYNPKDKYEMELSGEANTRVGLLAVDEAVLLLNNKQTLTRKSFFQDMEKLDQGEGEGDGDDLDTILLNSGLQHVIFDTEHAPKESVDSFHELPLFGLPGMSNARAAGTIFNHIPIGKESMIKNQGSGFGQAIKRTVAPPQTVRKYFPESWLFEEVTLESDGMKILDLTLPDSITTWNFMAVSLSPNRGVCVSNPLRQQVQKLFFADVRLPYKVTRLEEVKVKIAIYNYQLHPLTIQGIVTGVEGICFKANSMRGSSNDEHTFTAVVPSKGVVSQVVKIIPLKNGDLTLRVDLQAMYGRKERDVVEKKIYVVAEGLRVHKSITFVLDPEAKHMSYKNSNQEKITVQSSPTVNNTYDTKKKEQSTTIDLALPEEVIMGTESCRIAAFGDLMGDIITHAVVESKSLVDQPLADAEEVLGDLGPTVHALLYINKSGLASEELTEKGRRFISHSVVRLLKYRDGGFFKLTPESKPATWLTATVLKTLCYASELTFLDKESLIDKSFSWLAEQVKDQSGTVIENDARLSEDSIEYKVMLSAEVLIAVLECQRLRFEDHLILMSDMALFIEDNLHMVQQPMVLAKAAYALELFEEGGEVSTMAVNRLWSMKWKNDYDQFYWADKEVNESGSTPFWYKLGAKASSIEATAYALLVFLERHAQMEHVDSIADWLVGQRNENGAFIGAMDSTAAIQALSRYSLVKRQEELLKIDLSCNVSSEREAGRQTHSFKFTQQDATSPKSVDNVPVGQKLEVLTKGQGLGQMHVNVEYNIPVDKNANCKFKVTAEAKPTEIHWGEDMTSNPMCHACGIGCDKETPEEEEEKEEVEKEEMGVRYVVDQSGNTRGNGRDSRGKPILQSPPPPPKSGRVTKASRFLSRTSSSGNRPKIFSHIPPPVPKPSRVRRPSFQSPSMPTTSLPTGTSKRYVTASRKSICIHVCLRYLEKGGSGRTSVEVEMLTGYFPVMPDLERIASQKNVRNVQFLPERDLLVVQFDKIPSNKDSCFTLRATDELEVGKLTPASVVVKEAGLPQPSCSKAYDPPLGEESLQVFCADFSKKNRGECKCFSGICSSCLPTPGPRANMHYHDIMTMSCAAEVGYQLKLNTAKDQNQWVEIDATVMHMNKTGRHDIQPNDKIKLITPSSCSCPLFYWPTGEESNDRMYLLSPDVEKLVDRRGEAVYRYLLDEKSKILRVSDSGQSSSDMSKPSARHDLLKSAFLSQHSCS